MRQRIRTIKPEFFDDEKICALPVKARYLAVGLISLADDRGREVLSTVKIHGYVFPSERDARRREVGALLDQVVQTGFALAYDAAGVSYLWLPNFWRHQVINKPTESQLPAHPDDPYGELPIKEAMAQFREHYRSNTGTDPVALPSLTRARERTRASCSSSLPSVDVVGGNQRKAGRAPRRLVDQDQLPDGFDAALSERAADALGVLLGVHELRGGDLPTLRGVGLAMRRFPGRDHVRVVRDLEHWALAGPGQRKNVQSWTRTFATFLDNAVDGTPTRNGTGQPSSAAVAKANAWQDAPEYEGRRR